MKATRLTERQQELLAYMKADGQTAVFAREERIPDWPVLKKVLVALGGKWKSKGQAFHFDDDVDVQELLRLAMESGEILDPNAFEFFPTPPDLARELVELADMRSCVRVLEPSAGTGNIANTIRDAWPTADVTCVETFPKNVQALKKQGYEVYDGDFLAMTPDELGTFERVVANPPFSKRRDIQHVSHMLSFLAPGGKLVAVMSAGVEFRQDRTATQFRELVALHRGTITRNAAGSFKESGTMVNTVTVTMEAAR